MKAATQRFEAVDFTDDSPIRANTSRDERIRHAYQHGFADGAADAAAQATLQMADALKKLATDLDNAAAEASRRWTALEADAAECTILLARKLSAGLVQPEDIVAETVRAVLETLGAAPHLAIHVHPLMVPKISSILEGIHQPADLSRFITVNADEALAETDCHIVWSGGAIRRDTGQLNQDIEAIISRAFPAFCASKDPTP